MENTIQKKVCSKCSLLSFDTIEEEKNLDKKRSILFSIKIRQENILFAEKMISEYSNIMPHIGRKWKQKKNNYKGELKRLIDKYNKL